MEKIKAAAVSYLNTKPFLFGLENTPFKDQIDLNVSYPKLIAQQLMTGEAEIGLVPVAALPRIANHKIISNFCIGSDGPVGSVCVYSQIPLAECKQVYLDYQSRTSAALTRIILSDFKKMSPVFTDAQPGYEKEIADITAGLIIGDRALRMKKQFRFSFDLGEAWKLWTGNPFVFACWVSVKKLPTEWINSFEQALDFGISHIDEVISIEQKNYEGIDVKDYLTNKLSFTLTEDKLAGMKLFLEKI